MISAEDEDIDKQLQFLQNSKNSIKRYNDRIYDPDFPHIFILMHNNAGDCSHDEAIVKLEKMQK